MKIALYHNLPSGGAKRTVFETVRRLALRHELDVYTLSSANHSFCDLRPFVKHHYVSEFQPLPLFNSPLGRLNQWQRWRDLQRLNYLARQTAAKIDTGSYDAVLAHPCQWSQAPLILKYLRTPTIYYCHEPPRALYETHIHSHNGAQRWQTVLDEIDPLIRLYHATAKRWDKQATRAAQRVLTNSEFMRDTVARVYDIMPATSYHGVDTDIFRPMPGLEPQGYVLSVGAIQPHKGFDFLIESLGRLPALVRPTLRLVGNTETLGERHFLETLAARRGVNLQIEIGVSQETLVRRYNEAALLIYAPYNEPFGLAPLEAMACTCPVVGVAEGGVCETVVDRHTGRLVERDPASFAEAILSIMTDAPQRERYRQQTRAYILEKWTWNSATAQIERHLQEITGLTAL